MRPSRFGTATLIALTAPAIAADLPRPVAAAPPTAAFRWTGCAIGGHAGALWAESTEWIVRTPGGAFAGQSLGQHDLGGGVGGVQAGCDYQFAGGVVAGIGGDYSFADLEGSHDSAREFGVAYHSRIEGLASVTGRIGYAFDRFLGYLRGGVAWERDRYAASTIVIGTAYRASETRSGWTVGVGGEYAFSDVLSGFVEYSYADFGDRDIGLTPQFAGLRPAAVEIKETASVVRAGFNLRFGAAPN